MTEAQRSLMQVHQILVDASGTDAQLHPSHVATFLTVITTNIINLTNEVNSVKERLDKLPANNVQPSQAEIRKMVAEILAPLASKIDEPITNQAKEIEVLKETIQGIGSTVDKLIKLIQNQSGNIV